MILAWGLKKIPLLLEIPTLKDHLSKKMPADFRSLLKLLKLRCYRILFKSVVTLGLKGAIYRIKPT